MKPPPSARLIRGHRLAQGLVGAWTMAENGGLQVFDLSGNGNEGIIVAGAPWIPAKFGSGLSFIDASNQYVNMGTKSTLQPQIVTVVCWFKIDDDPSGSFSGLVATGAANNGYMLVHVKTGGKIRFYVRDATWQYAESNSAVTKGIWYNAIGTYDGTNVLLYINEVLQTTTDTATSINYGASITTLGRYAVSGSDDLTGCIDNASVYARALSASEVAELYWKPFCMFERKARTALMSGYAVPPVGAAGIMTTNAGFWGPTF